MNEKQRRLIDYFNRLALPAPPESPDGFEEGLAPRAPVSPPKPTPDLVRSMLERRQAHPPAGAADAIDESVAPPVAFGPEAAAPRGAVRALQPVERPITDELIGTAVSATEKALIDAE